MQHFYPHTLEHHSLGEETTWSTSTLSTFNASLREFVCLTPDWNHPNAPTIYRGTFGDVYRGNNVVAIKVLPSIPTSEMGQMKALLIELAIWQDIQHPNIAPMWMMYAPRNELPSFVSPWYQNGNLQEYTVKNPDADRMKLLSDIARGLKYIHENNLVHGDIRPANIMISENQTAVLTDFGFFKIRDRADDSFLLQTTTGRQYYMAPELCQSESGYTQKTDVWSYGCLSVAIMENTSPYSNILGAVRVILAQHSQIHPFQHLQYPWRDRNHMPVQNWRLMVRCLSINPEDRPDIRQFHIHTGSAEIKLVRDAISNLNYNQANNKDQASQVLTRSRL